MKQYFNLALLKAFLLKNPKIKWVIAGVLALVLLWALWGGIRVLFGLNEPKYRTVAVEEGPMVASIRASGTLNPVRIVTVGTAVSGLIAELNVDFNDRVTKGQTIARIDPRDYQARFDQAQANFLLAQKNYQLNLELANKGFVSKQALIQTEMAMRAAKGALDSAKKSLDDTYIRSPVDGVVVKRSVEVGQTVAASLSSPEIYIIAQNLAEMQVETSIDESDVGRIKEGLEASFTVDAFPGEVFKGKVFQIRKAPVTVQNVVTYTVLISADNPDLKLLPGMTANTNIVVDQRDKTLKVANAAMRFRLPSNDPTADKSQVRPQQRNVGRFGGASSPIRRVWVLESQGLKNVPVRKTFKIGLSDGDFTEILPTKEGQEPELKVGDRVIVGIEGTASTKSSATGPRMF